jgi:hypothetical protein
LTAPPTEPANVPRGYAPPKNYDIDLSQAYPDSGNQGKVKVRWRVKGTANWQEASAQVRISPMDIKRFYATPDGVLLGFTSFYGPVFTYDPAKGRVTILGRPQRSLYDALMAGDEWYFAGYPAATLRYDPQRPWNASSKGDDLHDLAKNPRLLKVAPQGAAKYHYYLAQGVDGFVYFGGHHERSGVGGSLGWYQPQTGLTGGLRDPFLKHDVSDLISAEGGRQIIFSSHGVGQGIDGKIFIFDVHLKKLVGEFVPLPGERDTGKLLEVAPGVVIGVVAKMPKSIVYRADLHLYKVLWQKELEGLAFGTVRGFDRRLIKGPDGKIWIYLNNTICRINPENGDIQKVLDAPPAGNLLFFKNDLYIYGSPNLRKVSGLFSQNPE